MNDPLVSVIINTRNRAHMVGKAIDSVYAQTYGNFEIILYDNASEDNTPELVKKYDHRLKYHRSAEYIPLAAARNNAIEKAKGEFICLLDSDDEIMPDKLARQVCLFADDGIGLVYSNAIINHVNLDKDILWYKTPPPQGMIFENLLSDYHIVINTVMFRKSAIGPNRRDWMNESFNQIEEMELFLKIAYKFRVAYVDEPLAKYVRHDGNLTDIQFGLVAQESLMLLDEFKALIPDFETTYGAAILCVKSRIWHLEGKHLWAIGAKKAEIVSAYIKSLKLYFRPMLAVEGILAASISYSMYLNLKRLKYRAEG